MTDKEYIASLVRERSHLQRLGDETRIEEVNNELRRLGHEAAPPAKRAEKRVTQPKETR